MPEYKRQHFLPAVYLKNFSAVDDQDARKSTLWRIDQNRCLQVPVNSQCADDYLFSKTNPKKSEEDFQKIEEAFAAAMTKVWNGQRPAPYEYFALILAAVDFLMRNIKHMNRTGEEGIHAYNQRINSFLVRIVCKHDSSETLTLDEMYARLKKNWRVRLFRPPPGRLIMTSDNPVVYFKLDKSNDASDCILFPLTPSICAAIFDARYICASGNFLRDSDVDRLIELLASQCNECFYTAEEPSETEVNSLRSLMKNRSTPMSVTDSRQWEFDTFKIPQPDIFSFIRPKTI